MRLLVALVMLASASADTCNPYYVFVPDTGDDTCFFRVERRCTTSYVSLSDHESYAWQLNQQDAYLENRTDAELHMLPASCQREFSQRLYLEIIDGAAPAGDVTAYLAYSSVSKNAPFPAAYPFVLYDDFWYQGLAVKHRTLGEPQSGLLVTALYPEYSQVRQAKQPGNTRPSDYTEKWNTTYTLIAIGGGVALIIVIVLLAQVCRHKPHDLRVRR